MPDNRDLSPQKQAQKQALAIFQKMAFNPSWIINGADPSLVKYAEFMGKQMATVKEEQSQKKSQLSSSQIRNVFGEIKRIQMNYSKNQASFYLLIPKVAYAVGRDNTNIGLRLFQLVFNAAADKVTDEKTYQNFCNLLEAVIAYHKAYKETND